MSARPTFRPVRLLILTLTALVGAAPAGRPNILLIMADDLGFECLGADGGTSYRTPVLDRLAASGLRCEYAFAQPLCTPTRVQLMTGQYNIRNYVRFGLLDRGQRTFAHLLRDAGYATCIAGKWQLGAEPDAPRHFGFDHSCLWQHTRGRTDKQKRDTRYARPRLDIDGEPHACPPGTYGPDRVCGFIEDFMTRHRERPFLVYYPMILTHCPFTPPPDTADWDPQSAGSASYQGDARYFGAMVTHMDAIVGRLVARLESLGLRERTLVLFLGDNGTDRPVVSQCRGRAVAGAKGQTTDAGTRVPLIANWPGTIPAGHVCTDLIDTTDVLPTLCEAVGVPIPTDRPLDGHSFWPQLRGRRGRPRNWTYCWYSRNGADDGARVFARTQRYKLYRSGDLYDLPADPREQRPLTEAELDAATRDVRTRLRAAIDRMAPLRGSGLSGAARRRAVTVRPSQ